MKLEVRVSADGRSDVWAYLTEDEAESIARALQARIERRDGHRPPGYHLHLDDSAGSELTLCVLDDDDESADG